MSCRQTSESGAEKSTAHREWRDFGALPKARNVRCDVLNGRGSRNPDSLSYAAFMDIEKLVRREGFPPGVQVETVPQSEGLLLRASHGERGLELFVTAGAQDHYGAGPTLALALGRLREAAEAGLPPRGADGSWARQVLVND